MTNIKPWWQSKTIWSGIASLLLTLYALGTGHPADQGEVQSLGQMLFEIANGILGLIAIWGRLSASSKIGG